MILIDYNGIAVGTIVMQKLSLDENLIRHVILNSIRLYRKRFSKEYGEVVIASDGMRSWRYDAFPNYKAKRKTTQKESSVDWKEVYRIINMIYEELENNFPYKTLKVPGCEADDIIAALAMNTQEFGKHEPVMIVSSDKDFVQLQKYGNVKQFSPATKKFYTEKNPRKQLAELILKGDQSDGVPNVLSTDNCFVEGIRQTPLRQKAVDQLIDDPKAMGDEIYRNYLRNKKLIDFEEIPESLKQDIINIFESQSDRSNNKRKVMTYLIENRCKQLIEEIGDFIL